MPRFYRLLLRAYPRALRERHGPEMAAAFDDQWRQAGSSVSSRARLVVLLLTDFLTSVRREWRPPQHGPRPDQPSGGRWPMPHFFTDARTAARHLLRAPMFTLGATLTLGLGIGATTAIFSLADATLLHPVPIEAPDEVFQSTFSWSLPDVRDLERDATVARDIAAWTGLDLGLDLDGTPQVISGLGVSGGFFALAGLPPSAGRLLQPADDDPGAPAVAVLSHRLWLGTFGADPGVVGRSVRLNQRPVTIVGIAPARFRGFSLREHPDIFLSLSTLPDLATGFLARPRTQTSRDTVWLQVAGRLREGKTLEQARAEVEQIYRRAHPPDEASNRIPEPIALVAMTARALGMQSTADLRRFLWVLMGATVVTLLLSCAAVASLLIVRIQGRRREFAIRAALGGGRSRLVRLLLLESLALGMGGGLVGLAAAPLTLTLLNTFQLPGNISIGDLGVTLNGALLAGSAAAGILTSLIFGLVPMWHASKVPAGAALAEGARGAARRPLRATLVGVQVAVCVVLLGGSLAFGRAIRQAVNVDLGFDTARTSMVSVDPSLARRAGPEIVQFMDDALALARQQPGITAAAWSKLRPYSGVMMFDISVPGYDEPLSRDIEDRAIEANAVTTGYFETLGIPILEGRDFVDTEGAQKVAVISESMATKYWPDRSAIGRQFATDVSQDPADILTVIGVVPDVQRGLSRRRAPTAYLLVGQQPWMLDFGGTYLFVRSTPEQRGTALASAATAIARADANMPITGAQALDDAFADTLMAQRLGLTLFMLFAGLAVILTGLGLYAVVASTVSYRRREIGIRVALGASGRSVVRLITRQGLRPVIAGLALGSIALWFASPLMDGFVLSGPAIDKGSVAMLAAAIVIVSAAAMFLPVRRALRIQPTVALKTD